MGLSPERDRHRLLRLVPSWGGIKATGPLLEKHESSSSWGSCVLPPIALERGGALGKLNRRVRGKAVQDTCWLAKRGRMAPSSSLSDRGKKEDSVRLSSNIERGKKLEGKEEEGKIEEKDRPSSPSARAWGLRQHGSSSAESLVDGAREKEKRDSRTPPTRRGDAPPPFYGGKRENSVPSARRRSGLTAHFLVEKKRKRNTTFHLATGAQKRKSASFGFAVPSDRKKGIRGRRKK